MPTTFIGLFLFSTALSLVATFSVLAVLRVVRGIGRIASSEGRRNSISD
jgi:hypothetical protein